ncbi:unnamed protein product [Arabis nemorensis]|uniref:Uncharacterized protein n=1 Tax=Arabis nemorensis TaxID=586526 RepID=A0A565CQB4_9BRAS|nr:unnamed protein product [Arabis nemorensis]
MGTHKPAAPVMRTDNPWRAQNWADDLTRLYQASPPQGRCEARRIGGNGIGGGRSVEKDEDKTHKDKGTKGEYGDGGLSP